MILWGVLKPDTASKIKPNGSDTTGDSTPEPGAKAKKKTRKKQGAPAGERTFASGRFAGGFIAGCMLPEATEPFRRTENGGIVTAFCQYNMRLAIAKLGVKLSYDSFAARMLITEGKQTQALGDAETERLFLQSTSGLASCRTGSCFGWSSEPAPGGARFTRCGDYLDLLQWDQKPRLDTWLTEYAGADDTPYIRAVGRLVLVAAVRRIRQPGVKFDEMLVLEGPQGNNKSSALAVLAIRPEWFSDDLPLMCSGKEVIERTSGKWIVEAAELSGMRQGIIEHIKAFLSRQIDKARMSYDRLPTERPRQFIVIGTTNSGHYLKDTTGNRRFWPVKVEGFDLEALARDRDQLWAEAVEADEEKEAIRLDPALIRSWRATGQAAGARTLDRGAPDRHRPHPAGEDAVGGRLGDRQPADRPADPGRQPAPRGGHAATGLGAQEAAVSGRGWPVSAPLGLCRRRRQRAPDHIPTGGHGHTRLTGALRITITEGERDDTPGEEGDDI